MAILEQRSCAPKTDPETPANRPMRIGLSPAVEKMFGVLVGNIDEAGEVTSPESEAPRPKQPGAA